MTVLALTVAAPKRLVEHVAGDADTTLDVAQLAQLPGRAPADLLPTWDRLAVIAESVHALRALLPALTSLPPYFRVLDVAVAGLPRGGLLSVPDRAVGLRPIVEADRRVERDPVQHVRLTVRFGGRVTVAAALGAILEGARGRGRPMGGLKVGFGAGAAGSLVWGCGDPAASRLDPAMPILDSDDPSPVDVVVSTGPQAPSLPGVPAVAVGGVWQRPSWQELVTASEEKVRGFLTQEHIDRVVPPVDTDVLNPIGFDVAAGADVVRVRRTESGPDARIVFETASRALVSFGEWTGLSERAVDLARGYRAVQDEPAAHSGPVDHAWFLAQAACAALPVVATDMSSTTRRMLGERLSAVIGGTTVDDLADPLRREMYCMELSRLAYSHHGGRARWGQVARDLGLWSRPPISVSVILATRRPELLARAAEQIRRQDWPHLELVLGLHGFGADHPAVAELAKSFDRPITVLEIPVERNLGAMLNDLSDAASGDAIAKMDDDDWYSTHHITDLVHASEFSRAELVGSGAEFMYLEALDVTIRRHRSMGNRFSNRVPGAALLLAKETLHAIGGWRPIRRGIDTALAQSVSDSGGVIYRTHGLGFMVYRAADGHTWDPGVEYFLRGDVDQWTGFVPPPTVAASAPETRPLRRTWPERLAGRSPQNS